MNAEVPQRLLMVQKVYLDEIVVTAILTYIYAASTSFINKTHFCTVG